MLQRYRWRGRNRQGQVFRGEMNASDNYEVARYVMKQIGYVTAIEPISANDLRARMRRKKLSAKEKESFFRQLVTLLQSGVPLLRCLELMSERSKGRMRDVCGIVSKELQKGHSLTNIFANLPKDFDELAVRVVEAGENSGNLVTVFNQMADYYRDEVATGRSLRNALIYPVLVLFLSTIALGFFMSKVFPFFTELYESLQLEKTGTLELLVVLKDFMGRFGYGLLLAAFILACCLWRTKSKWRQYILRLPIIRKYNRQLLETRYSRLLSILLSSGIALPVALQAAGRVITDDRLKEQAEGLAREVLTGRTISRAAVEYKDIFSPMTIEFISVGENSGSLAEMLGEASAILDKELAAALKDMKVLLEPVLMLFVAGIVGCIIFTLTGPIFGLVNSLGAYK